MATSAKDRLFRGKTFSAEELATIEDLVTSCAGLSQAELAHTVCELLDWKRPTGAVKSRECRDLLEQLEREGRLSLPCKRAAGRPRGSRTRVPVTAAGDPGEELIGTVRDFGEVKLELVEGAAAQHRFRELIGRYHSLGYRVPFGAHLRYLVYVSKPQRVVVGACQFSSPAWRMAVRDRWIGWDEATRKGLRRNKYCNLDRTSVSFRHDDRGRDSQEVPRACLVLGRAYAPRLGRYRSQRDWIRRHFFGGPRYGDFAARDSCGSA